MDEEFLRLVQDSCKVSVFDYYNIIRSNQISSHFCLQLLSFHSTCRIYLFAIGNLVDNLVGLFFRLFLHGIMLHLRNSSFNDRRSLFVPLLKQREHSDDRKFCNRYVVVCCSIRTLIKYLAITSCE